MTPEQMVGLALGCVAGGVVFLALLLLFSRRRNSDLQLDANLRDMEVRIEQLGGALRQAESTIRSLRETLEEASSSEMMLHNRPAANTERIGEIVRLSETGMDVLEIARRIDMPTGEVELVLNLHTRGKTGAARP